jgi:hypothetical protein
VRETKTGSDSGRKAGTEFILNIIGSGSIWNR